MKYILNENKKFILTEHFRLNEDTLLTEGSIEDTTITWAQKLSSTFDNAKAALEKFKDFAQMSEADAATQAIRKTLKTNVAKAADDLENTLDLPTEKLIADNSYKGKLELKDYIKVLTQIKTAIPATDETEDTFTLLDKYIIQLGKISTTAGPWTEAEIKYIRKAFNLTTERLPAVLDTPELDATKTDIENFKKLCDTCLDLIKNISENIPKIPADLADSVPEDLKAFNKLMKTLVDAIELPAENTITKDAIVSHFKNYYTQVQELHKNYTQIQQSALVIQQTEKNKKAKVAADIKAENRPLSRTFKDIFTVSARYEKFFTDTHWNYSKIAENQRVEILTKFINDAQNMASSGRTNKQCPTRDKLWQAYFSWVWNDNKFIISIKDILVDQLIKLGWTADVNPFLKYLSYIIKNKTIYETPTYGSYAAVHNLYAKNIINAKHLSGENTLSLIYCPAVLKITDGNTVFRMIEKCSKLLKSSEKQLSNLGLSADDQIKQKLISFCFIEQPSISNIEIDEITWDTFKKFVEKSSDVVFTDSSAQLRKETNIDAILQNLSVKVNKEKTAEPVTDEKAKEIWEAITSSPIGLNPKDLETLFYYLVLTHAKDKSQFNKWSAYISKTLFGEEKLLQNTGNLLDNLALFNKFIEDLDITNFSDFLKLILKAENLPDPLKPKGEKTT